MTVVRNYMLFNILTWRRHSGAGRHSLQVTSDAGIWSMLHMAAVAERLVVRFPATAEGDPVPYRVGFPVGGHNRDSAPYPEWPVLALCRIFDDNNGPFQDRLDQLPASQVPDNKPAGRAIAGLFDCSIPRFRDT